MIRLFTSPAVLDLIPIPEQFNLRLIRPSQARTGSLTIATQTVVVDQTNPTAIRFNDFTATSSNGSTVLNWQTGYEVDNLGFNVYRTVNGVRTQLNPSLIAGSALMVGSGTQLQAGQTYSWVDQQPVRGATYSVEDIGLNGVSTGHMEVAPKPGSPAILGRSTLLTELSKSDGKSIHITGYPQGVSPTSDLPGDGSLVTSASGSNTRGALITKTTVSKTLQNQWSIAALASVKMLINQAGWYRVSLNELYAAGLNPAANTSTLQLFVGGEEVPIKVTSQGVEFYAAGLDTPTTDSQAYWLVAGQQNGKRIAVSSASATSGASTSFNYTVQRKDRLNYVSSLLNGDTENFFGPLIAQPGGPTPSSQNVTIQHHDASATGNAQARSCSSRVYDIRASG